MPTTTSQLFDFLDEHQSFGLECHEIASAAFADLRYSVRLIVMSLSQSDDHDASENIGRMRAVLSEWLTVPVRFDDAMSRALREMGQSAEVEARWGRDIRGHYENAIASADELIAVENPLRAKLAELIRHTSATELSLHIFCHRRAREHFESLQSDYEGLSLGQDVFVHSVAQYRELEPFNWLLKVGPLRSRGWGAAPDALVTAPRFDTLVQVVWSGCSNEPGFGYDPAISPSHDASNAGAVGGNSRTSNSGGVLRWKEHRTQSRDGTVGKRGSVPDVDDLDVFSQLRKPSETQAAILVQVDDEHGILYPPHSTVMGLDPNTCHAQMCLPGETLTEGMSLILPVVNDVHLAGLQAEDGRFSDVWKTKLRSEYSNDPEGLVKRLRDAGLKLSGLHPCINHWCKTATTVIHAPQQKRHFEILIRVLGISFDAHEERRARRTAWWQYAWDEIRRSRGEAIQTGIQEQQIVDQQLLEALASLADDIRAHLDQPAFELMIPDSVAVGGVFKFYRIIAIEAGLTVPKNELRMLCELERIDQWRD
jgi:hypothetical protein